MIIACPACGVQYDVRALCEGTQVQCRCHQLLTVPPHIVDTVRCPQCGGTVDAAAERCRYCRARIATQRCGQCSAAVRADAKFCDQCGAVIDSTSAAMARASELTCPRCQVPLFHETCAEQPIEGCAECLGTWLSHDAFDAAMQGVRRHVARAGGVAPPAPAGAPRESGAAAYVSCPSCGQVMNPRNLGGAGTVIVHTCVNHGVWCDAGALYQVREAVARYGPPAPLPRARNAAQAIEARRRVQAETVAAIERERDERIDAVIGDKVLDMVDSLRQRWRERGKDRRRK